MIFWFVTTGPFELGIPVLPEELFVGGVRFPTQPLVPIRPASEHEYWQQDRRPLSAPPAVSRGFRLMFYEVRTD